MKAKFQQSAGNSNTCEMDNLKYKVVRFHEDGNTSMQMIQVVQMFQNLNLELHSTIQYIVMSQTCAICVHIPKIHFPLCALF